MAFENVDVQRVRLSLKALKNSLIINEEQMIFDSICSENNFKTLANDPLKKGLKKLLDERYGELSSLIDIYQKIVDYVEEYQKLDKEVSRLEREIDDEYDDEDPSYSKIRRLKRKKANCLNRMDEIVSTVDSMI